MLDFQQPLLKCFAPGESRRRCTRFHDLEARIIDGYCDMGGGVYGVAGWRATHTSAGEMCADYIRSLASYLKG